MTTTDVADTADLTFEPHFLNLSTYESGPYVAVHLTDQLGHRRVTEWVHPGSSEATYCLNHTCEEPGHRRPNRLIPCRLDIPAARKVALAEQGLTRFLPGGQS